MQSFTSSRPINLMSHLLFLMIFFASVIAMPSYAENFKEYEKLVRDKQIYPRECKYLVPAVIPLKNKIAHRDQLDVLTVLEQMGLVTLSIENDSLKVKPHANTYGLIQQNVDIQYSLISVNLVLGTWDIEVTEVKKLDSNILVQGRRVIKEKTKIYAPVTNVLSLNIRNICTDTLVQWLVKKEGGTVSVVERPVAPER